MAALDEVLGGLQKVSASWVPVAQNARQAVDTWNGVIRPVFTPETPHESNAAQQDVAATDDVTEKVTSSGWGWKLALGLLAAGGLFLVGKALFSRK